MGRFLGAVDHQPVVPRAGRVGVGRSGASRGGSDVLRAAHEGPRDAAGTGVVRPRWSTGGVLSRRLLAARQCGGRLSAVWGAVVGQLAGSRGGGSETVGGRSVSFR